MFEHEGLVICIIEWGYGLIYGKEYKILGKVYDNVESSYYYRLYDDSTKGLFPEDFFVTPLEFRKLKLLKLKERICLNVVIK